MKNRRIDTKLKMAIRLISVLIFAFIISIVTGQQRLGSFTLKSGKTAHKLSSGPIIVKDDHTFEIPNLHYDGTGPDTYFMIGTGDPPVEYPKKAPGMQNTKIHTPVFTSFLVYISNLFRAQP